MTSLFPSTRFDSCESFGQAYFEDMARCVAAIDFAALEKVAAALSRTIAEDRFIFIAGNGGSAAIANHALCDFQKGLRTETGLRPRMISLAAHTETISALSNDISHGEIFAEQLTAMARKGDLIWVVSSSGNSPNVIRALETGRDIGMITISFTGFGGGRCRELAEINAHVDGTNYGVIEDIHMAFVHIVAQFLRLSHIDPARLGKSKF